MNTPMVPPQATNGQRDFTTEWSLFERARQTVIFPATDRCGGCGEYLSLSEIKRGDNQCDACRMREEMDDESEQELYETGLMLEEVDRYNAAHAEGR